MLSIDLKSIQMQNYFFRTILGSEDHDFSETKKSRYVVVFDSTLIPRGLKNSVLKLYQSKELNPIVFFFK